MLEELQWEGGRGHQGALHWRCLPPMELCVSLNFSVLSFLGVSRDRLGPH